MPLDGGGTASKPAGTTAVAGATIESSKFNSVIDDLYAILNAARPVVYGGTGATSASAARTALGLAIGADVQAYDAALASLAGLAFVSGDIVYATAADTLARLAKGTDGQFLSLASGVPAWATVSDGGWTQIGSSVPTSSGTTVTISSVPSGYRQYCLRFSSNSFSSTAALSLEASVDGGSSWGGAVAITGSMAASTYVSSGFVIIDADALAGGKHIIGGTETNTGSLTAINEQLVFTVSALSIDTLRLSGGTFDGGSVTLWGIK